MAFTNATMRMYLELDDPTVNDDAQNGFEVGNFWLNSVTGNHFQSNSVQNGNAVWKKLVMQEDPISASQLTVNGLTITAGEGEPSSSQPKGSLYLRSDGAALTGRLYVATDSAGTWTSFPSVL